MYPYRLLSKEIVHKVVPDKIRTTKTGVYAQGDAAFSNYTINFGASFSFK